MANKEYPYYILYKNTANEWHLFGYWFEKEGIKTVAYVSKYSICEKMYNGNRNGETNYMNEHNMRMDAAGKGRVVCGTCISHLYASI